MGLLFITRVFMKIIKIDRGSVDIEVNGHLLSIKGEAMLPKQAPEIAEYVLYKNSLHWKENEGYPNLSEEELYAFLEEAFLQRNLRLIIE